jgi:hypothetical protein
VGGFMARLNPAAQPSQEYWFRFGGHHHHHHYQTPGKNATLLSTESTQFWKSSSLQDFVLN